jgi:hypothetical protein
MTLKEIVGLQPCFVLVFHLLATGRVVLLYHVFLPCCATIGPKQWDQTITDWNSKPVSQSRTFFSITRFPQEFVIVTESRLMHMATSNFKGGIHFLPDPKVKGRRMLSTVLIFNEKNNLEFVTQRGCL